MLNPVPYQAPFAQYPACDPCINDPLYNPPPRPCGSGPCGSGPCGSGPYGGGPCGGAPCGPSRGPCNTGGCGTGCKDPCPLKSFCDPGLANTCAARPLINPNAPRRAVSTWKINYLVSNFANKASHSDEDLINPWGIIIWNNQLWVANGSTDSITNYDLFGNKLIGSISVRDAAHNSSFPTGLVVNCGGGFAVSANAISRSGLIVAATEHGTVHTYNPDVAPLNSFVVLNQQLTGEVAVYKGLAIANNTLYLADFFQGHIDVFDSNYNRLLGFHFQDGDSADPIPLDYTPNNIVHIGCYLYIIYARRDPNVTVHDLDGPGHGFISVFNLDGTFVRRFTSRGVLNSPWAMIPAPCECGFPPGSFLVGNNGDGRINIFDCAGRYVGPLLNQAGLPIIIPGLWGLAPHYTTHSEIYFAASPDEDVDGVVGNVQRDQIIYF